MRKSFRIAVALVALTATSSRAEAPSELYRQWNDLNDKCFSLALDDPEGVKACRKRQKS